MKYRLDVEIGPDGSAQAFLPSLPGCYSRAPTLTEALRKAPAKIRTHLAWLRNCGEPVPSARDDIEVEVCEVVQGDWLVNLGDSVALFACDRRPVSPDEMGQHLPLMHWSWRDFTAVLRRVPRGALRWKPEATTPRHIQRITQHVALVQIWYLWKLRTPGDPIFRWPRGTSVSHLYRAIEHGDIRLRTLNTLRAAVTYRLAHLRPYENGRATHHQPGGWTKRTAPEAWTAWKVLRRLLWHERLHLATMTKLLRLYIAQRRRR